MSDLFGTRPAYYHASDPSRVETDLHRFIPAQPDEVSVTDYLAFGELWRHAHTFLQDVRRVVPPAAAQPLPEVTPTTAPPRELVAAFWAHLRDAVAASVAEAREVVISLSGGLDSAALARAAVELLGPDRVRAVTLGFERDFNDPEPDVARALCEHLGIRWEFVPCDSTTLLGEWPWSPIWPDEPRSVASMRWDSLMPGADGVILWGIGGDSLMRGDRQHYAGRARRGEWRQIVGDVVDSVIVHGRRPALRLRRPGVWPTPSRPPWLSPHAPGFDELAALRADLPPTWRRGVDELAAPVWSYYFESEAPQHTGRPHRYVYPFFDAGLANFVNAVPTAPWCVDKEILRAALRGRVPDSIRLRPKAPQAGEPRVTFDTTAAEMCRDALDRAGPDPAIDADFVRTRLVPGVYGWSDLAPVVRCCSVARWRAGLTDIAQTTTNSGGGS